MIAAAGEIVIEHHSNLVARHPLVAPGEVSIVDEHYGGPRRGPSRAVRAKTGTERAFLALGPAAEQFIRQAAAAGVTKLATELGLIVDLEAAWGRDALSAAVERALAFRRFKAADVRSILEAGDGLPAIVAAGDDQAGLPCASHLRKPGLVRSSIRVPTRFEVSRPHRSP